jgi:hypothetical protein
MEPTYLTPVNPLFEAPSRLSGRHRRRSGGAALAAIASTVLFVAAATPLCAQTSIPVPNGSFESPETDFAVPQVDSWEMTPQPLWYDEGVFGGPWSQLTGVFLNTNFSGGPIIENLDGLQAAFLFSVPEVGLFQDHVSVGGTNSTPSNEFDAIYEVGKAYRLTVGLTTSSDPGYSLMEGETLQLSFYYRDGASNRVTLASRTVTYSTNVFTNPFQLLDYDLTIPTVEAADAWAGKHIGIEFVSTVVTPNFTVWDLDNVRLIEFVSPTLADPVLTGAQFEFDLLSDPGAHLEVLASTNVSQVLSNWTSLGTITNTSGLTNFLDAGVSTDHRFYSVRQLP